ncbi:MAG: hypothetical protein JNK05_28710 [Myxococcales bacterium]|nr:hypothetical protein [Myxococcales bacterium]
MSAGFLAPCRHCGEQHAVTLVDATAPCTRCGAAAPLDPAQRAAVDEALEKALILSSRAQQRAQRRDATSRDFALAMLAIAGSSGIFFAAMAAANIVSEVPPTLTLKALMKLKQSATGDTAEMAVVSAWWQVFAFALWASSTLTATFVTLWALRKPPPALRALAPIEVGERPRCRLCGSGLSKTSATPTCSGCGAVNTVDKRVAEPQTNTLDEQLAWIGHEQPAPASLSGRWQYAIVAVFAALPMLFLLALTRTITGTHATHPNLYPLIPGAFALASAASLLWLSRFASAAPTVRDARVGSAVRVSGRRYTVRGRLVADARATLRRPIIVLDPVGEEGPSMALDLAFEPRATVISAWTLVEGGAPFTTGDREAQVFMTLVERGRSTALVAVPGDETRLFEDAPPIASEPRWTMRRAELSADDVVLVG